MRIEDEDSSIRLFTVKWKEINSYSWKNINNLDIVYL